MNAESQRLQEARDSKTPWKKWGPYLSERQWGTVREDYSDNGNAWDYFSHDQARSRAYHWGEDGLAGISDDQQRLCFALALWNGQGSHHQGAAVRADQQRGQSRRGREGVLLLPRQHADAFVHEVPLQVSAGAPIRTTIWSRPIADAAATSPSTSCSTRASSTRTVTSTCSWNTPRNRPRTSWFRSASTIAARSRRRSTCCRRFGFATAGPGAATIRARCSSASPASPASFGRPSAMLGERYLYCDGQASLLFTENETNTQRLFGAQNRTPFVKDGINNYVVHGQRDAVNPQQTGTKVAAHYRLTVPPGKCEVVRLRLTPVAPDALSKSYGKGNGAFGKHFDEMMETRRQEADEFYASVIPPSLDADAANVMRQALAGMLWSKQFYYFDVNRWLEERGSDPFQPSRKAAPRNEHWHHMYNADIISMPDKWEYPWYAAWDLAFHVLPLTLVDPDFGKQQLDLMLRENYHAPERADPGLRMELRRRQSAGARLGDDLHLSTGESADRQGRHRLAGAQFPEAAAQLHLVAQPQGPRGQECLRGRIPRAGQHRRLRPQLAAADRRLPRTGRRHGLDGALQPEHARDQHRAGDAQRGLRGHGPQIHPALRLDRLGDDPRGRQHRHVG